MQDMNTIEKKLDDINNSLKRQAAIHDIKRRLREFSVAEDPHRAAIAHYLMRRRDGLPEYPLRESSGDYASDTSLARKVAEECASIYLLQLPLRKGKALLSIEIESPRRSYKGLLTLSTGAHLNISKFGITVSLRNSKTDPREFAEELAKLLSSFGFKAKVAHYDGLYLTLFEDDREQLCFQQGEPEPLLEAVEAGVPLSDIGA